MNSSIHTGVEWMVKVVLHVILNIHTRDDSNQPLRQVRKDNPFHIWWKLHENKLSLVFRKKRVVPFLNIEHGHRKKGKCSLQDVHAHFVITNAHHHIWWIYLWYTLCQPGPGDASHVTPHSASPNQLPRAHSIILVINSFHIIYRFSKPSVKWCRKQEMLVVWCHGMSLVAQ